MSKDSGISNLNFKTKKRGYSKISTGERNLPFLNGSLKKPKMTIDWLN
jgi:hypothetical protein